MFRVAENLGRTVRSVLGVEELGEPLTLVESWWWEAFYAREPRVSSQQMALLISRFSKGKQWQDFMPAEFVDYDKESQLDLMLQQDHQRLLGRQLEAIRQQFGKG